MAAWTSPLHFRVRAPYRTGTKLRTELQREDEQKWEWVIPKEEVEYSTSAQSAGSNDMRPNKEKWERARPKNETASNTGSDDTFGPSKGLRAAAERIQVGSHGNPFRGGAV